MRVHPHYDIIKYCVQRGYLVCLQAFLHLILTKEWYVVTIELGAQLWFRTHNSRVVRLNEFWSEDTASVHESFDTFLANEPCVILRPRLEEPDTCCGSVGGRYTNGTQYTYHLHVDIKDALILRMADEPFRSRPIAP